MRANYTNLQEGIYETTEYLEMFLRNLLLSEKNELHNRNLHIGVHLADEKVDIQTEKVEIETKKVNIQTKKVDIQTPKVDFESRLSTEKDNFSYKTIIHIYKLFDKYGYDDIFGRSMVAEVLEIQSSSASKLIKKLLSANIIEPVTGYGKGKYRFLKN